MKVFNITDASTPALRNRGLENLPFKVGETIIPVGSSAVLRGTAKERSELQSLLKAGAASIDELPEWYAMKRGLNMDGTPVAPPPPEVIAPKVAEAFAEPIQEDPLEGVPKRKGSK